MQREFTPARAAISTWHRAIFPLLLPLFAAVLLTPPAASANLAGGGTGSGPDVTVKDNPDGTVTMSNGIATIVIVKNAARLNSVKYTCNNSGTSTTTEMLQSKGQYYYGGFSLGSGVFTYTLATDPAKNGGNYADVMLLSNSEKNGVMEAHFSMLRGSSGYYSTGIMTHRAQDVAFEVGAWGVVTRVPPVFNWLSADSWRNFFIGARSSKGKGVPNSPHEITVLLDGANQGEFADKFIYGQDHVDLRAWGWSSVGKGGLNVGTWMTTNMEFSNGGPMKRDVSVYPYSELNNSILTGELGMGSDGHFSDGEKWTKTCGPWFFYFNNVPTTITDPAQAAAALYKDALAQAEAEKQAWPYPWFKHPNFVPESGRGTVTGKFVINDAGNPNASAAGLWVGLEEQPLTNNGTHDFQKWLKPYQFWVQTDADGNFTIPHVLPGTNYTLWAYGPGAAGTFISQNQAGGNPPLEINLPAKPFAVTAKAGGVTALGTVTWTPVRVGATVFELGVPNRKADDFRHGEDYWTPGKSPKLGFPTPEWGGQVAFPLDFPNGMTYTVGKSQWPRDWNYVLPSAPDVAGAYQPCTGTINFNLAQAPMGNAAVSLYIGCAGDDGGKIIVTLNGTNLGTASGVTAAPNAIEATGFNPPYSDDSSIHFGVHGPFSDERINFPASLLRAGQNTLSIQMDARGGTAYLMVDYLRLELAGYLPPAPAGAAAYAGNSRNLVCWRVAPGASSYDVLRSTVVGSGYAPVASGLVEPVCGSGVGVATFLDTTAANGTAYYYKVQSVSPAGRSQPCPPSLPAKPAAALAAAAPVAVKLTSTGAGHHRVALQWNASPGAAFYRVSRTTMYQDGVGGMYPLRSMLLDDAASATTYMDDSPTDGRIYRYQVEAVNAGGTSAPSVGVTVVPRPAPPAAAPTKLAAQWMKPRNGPALKLTWDPVPGATGYVIYRTTGADRPFQWPANFLTTLVPATYTDMGITDKKATVKGLDPTVAHSYQVTAVNVGGISSPVSIKVPPR